MAALLLLTAPVAAQGGRQPSDEATLLRRAAALEATGELDAAAAVLRALLNRQPNSTGALFALERVLRTRGTLADILPVTDRAIEADPRAPGARSLKLRVLVEMDSLEALEDEGRRWIEADPASADPYREVARFYRQAFGPERALAVLREGREALADPDALAAETGDVLLESGRIDEAVTEWSRAVGPDGEGSAAVLGRLETLDEAERADVARLLVRALDADPTSTGRRRAGVRIALAAGVPDEALPLAEHVLPELEGNTRRGFLGDLARQSQESGAPGVTVWAYRRLQQDAADEGERRALDVRIAAAALAAADTSGAVEAQTRLAEGLPQGSDDRRRALADLIRVKAGRADADELTQRLAAFRREFPDAPELDGLAASVASALAAAGDLNRASAILEGVEGPRSALERGYILLERGDVANARTAFSSALPGLSPSEATPVIQLTGLLGRLGGRGRELVASTAVMAHRGRVPEAVQDLREGLSDLPEDEGATALAQGARLADDAGFRKDAAELRRAILEGYPDAPEVEEATLALARYRAQQDGGVPEAIQLLETLILERPDASLVPDARRELEKLKARGGEGRP